MLLRQLRGIFAVAALAVSSTAVVAQDAYPTKPISIVVNFPAAGPLDLIARALSESATRELKQTVVIENRAGAAGNIGAAFVSRADPDGYTLLLTLDTVLSVNPHVYSNVGFDVDKNLDIISLTGKYSQVLVAHPKLNVKTFAEFAELAKKEDISYGSAGMASPGNLVFELLKDRTGILGTHIPYKGNAPAIRDLVAGEVAVGFLATAGALPYIRDGRLVPLLMPGNERVPSLPDVPAASELGIDNFSADGSFVLAAPAGVPEHVVKTWQKQVDILFASPDFRAWMEKFALNTEVVHGEQAQTWLQQSSETWKEVIEKSQISLD